jgi:demethylmenaquinone methyltransferase/2-methoxy-6-polyprenyl-1,4-benzoquinol methylase
VEKQAMSADVQHQIETTYTQKARSYDAWVHTMTLGIEARLRQRLIRRLELGPGDKVLDLACGTGLNFPFIQDCIGSTGRLIGVDLTPAMLAQARERVAAHGWNNVVLIHADATSFKLSEPVDTALCTLAIGLMPDSGAVIRALVDAVRPGGQVLISDGRLVARWYGPLANPLLRWIGAPWVPPVVRGHYWAARPWEALAALTEDYRYEEWLGGALYVASGFKPELSTNVVLFSTNASRR